MGDTENLHEEYLRQNFNIGEVGRQIRINLVEQDLMDMLASFDNRRAGLLKRLSARCHILDFVKELRPLHELGEDCVGIVLNVGGIKCLQHGGIEQVVFYKRFAIHSVLLQDMHDGCQKLMHALAVPAAARVQLAVDEEDIENEKLNPMLVVVGLVWQALDVLLYLSSYHLILAKRVPRRLRKTC